MLKDTLPLARGPAQGRQTATSYLPPLLKTRPGDAIEPIPTFDPTRDRDLAVAPRSEESPRWKSRTESGRTIHPGMRQVPPLTGGPHPPQTCQSGMARLLKGRNLSCSPTATATRMISSPSWHRGMTSWQESLVETCPRRGGRGTTLRLTPGVLEKCLERHQVVGANLGPQTEIGMDTPAMTATRKGAQPVPNVPIPRGPRWSRNIRRCSRQTKPDVKTQSLERFRLWQRQSRTKHPNRARGVQRSRPIRVGGSASAPCRHLLRQAPLHRDGPLKETGPRNQDGIPGMQALALYPTVRPQYHPQPQARSLGLLLWIGPWRGR